MRAKIGDAGPKGRGIFATKRIEAETEIIRDPCLVLHETCGLLNEYVYHKGGRIHLAMGYGSFVNHDSKPNAYWMLESGEHSPELVLYAKHQIRKGEEILISYNGCDDVSWDDL